MRLKTAAAFLLLGLIALVAGIGQLTWWAPEKYVTAVVPADTKAAPLTVIDGGLAQLRGDDATLTVRGEGNFVLAAARPDEVEAWVGKAAHNTIDGASEDGRTLTVTHADGEPSAPNPAGADLFASTQSASGTLEYRWDFPAEGEWQLVLASDGKAAAPQDVTITWPSQASAPWAIPLVVIGGILLLAAVVLAVLGTGRGRGGTRGPGRGGPTTGSDQGRRSGPAPRGGRAAGAGRASGWSPNSDRGGFTPRRAAPSRPSSQRWGARAAAGAVVLVLAGPVALPAAQATGSPSEQAAAPQRILLEEQLQRILEQTANAVQTGDNAKDAAKLAPRVAGTALLARTKNYKVRTEVAKAPALAPVRATDLLSSVVTTTRTWPRTVVAVTQGEGNTTPQLLTLRQATPRENYKLIEAVPLLPGNTFPSTASAGAETLALDAKEGLAATPAEAIAGVADRLSSAKSKWKDRIPGNAYITDTHGYQADIVKSSPNAKFTFKHSLVGKEATAFRTADGGALVFAPLDFLITGTPKEAGDKVTLQADAAVLAGGNEATGKMTLTFRETVAVYISPEGGDGKVTLIGATRNLSAASVG
ncbi:hypothetical protein [Sinomonas halotolerans]|uniref:DUF8094 domain-containing protein n=1 Tax=Sinomonas halotolerans TaxID=1644133 RepID=A0ABU9WWS1_9MICC